MKRWKKYDAYLASGDWHVHTNYTDGKNTVFEYCKQGEHNGLKLIVFSEHVRRKLDYNFDDFISDVYSAKDKFDIEILVGCETKVLDLEGSLDVSEEVLEECEIVLGAFHSFEPPTKEAYLTALSSMISNTNVDIWAHPTLYSIKNKIVLDKENIYDMVNLCIKNEVLIEKNMKYNVPDHEFLKIADILSCNFVNGSDAHQISELLKINKNGE